MEVVKVDLMVNKETMEVFQALAAIIEDVKAKKEFSAILAENAQALLKAIDGATKIPEEIKSKEVGATLGYGMGLVAGAFLS